MDYTITTDDNRREMLINRIAQAESEHWQHTLNLEMAEAWAEGAPGRQVQIDNSKLTLEQIEAGLTALRARLASLAKSAKTRS